MDWKKKISNLVSVAGASLTVPRNEIRVGGEKVMKRVKKKRGEIGKERYEHPNRRGRACDCRDREYISGPKLCYFVRVLKRQQK